VLGRDRMNKTTGAFMFLVGNSRIGLLLRVLPLLFLVAAPRLWAQAADRQVALIPFWGEDREIAAQFGDELFAALTEIPGLRPFWVDMYNLPPDVPAGGFPPSVSPSPSLTRGASLAITGNVFYNQQGERCLRLYLWQVPGYQPLFSDEMLALDRDTVGMVMPFMVRLLSQRIPDPEPPAPVRELVVIESERVIVFQAPPVPDRWLYLGLRAGGNLQIFDPQLFHTGSAFDPGWRADELDLYLGNVSAAAQLNAQLLGFHFAGFPLNPLALFLGLQVEGVFTQDFDNGALSLVLPAMLRITARGGNSSLSLLGGAYLLLPLGDNPGLSFGLETESVGPFAGWGYTLGFVMGNRVGPGSVFVDMRLSNDMFTSRIWDYFRRGMVSVSMGYELGFLARGRGGK